MSQATSKKYDGFGTTAIHAAQEPNPIHGAVMPGIELATTYAQQSPGVHRGFEYSRTGNPTRVVLEKLIASLENAQHGLCFASGSAATASVTSILRTGDHIISIDDVYGGTNRYFQKIAVKVNGMKVSFVELGGTNGARNLQTFVEQKCASSSSSMPRPKMIWIETPTNPMLKCVDIAAVSAVAHKYDAIVVVDNTFATPFNQQPMMLGADIVVHSITKYLNGHSDVVMGVAVTNSEAIRERLAFVQNSLGAVPAPFDCYMVIRGIKTLHVRMARHAQNALQVAKYLESHPKIERVFYPHLASHPDYNIARSTMKTGGGMITFLLKGGLQESRAFLENLKLFTLAESLGAVESLAEHPAIMTHASVPAQQRQQLGIMDNLVRLSIGIEEVDDILKDLRIALDHVAVVSKL
mmetsp:Transcript_10767/g.16183  ORF Transcript_10767/g.16183 Transcript_10767/m.16183 type:complete len:410 (-) Transcript_10767:97-1326(-)|eukprot:CAMPEP_0202713598 /NCGR_PEP_ID=MMETSP1385-20130828/56773_1 /ASSEMBLY_ACC=CAM_ASM_000861 /TAXON_ID=933848 /ORGANISM="Elphidium margaritaceum" /LENGTH=409 /DNA_ID=CAMNT_0049374007 /DNA_START=48 /DNA_END=1277 /DNA_ORIENTATION=+